MRRQVVQLARHVVLDALEFMLALAVAVGFIVVVWWLGKITKLWWLLGILRERWRAGQAGLPEAGPCQWPSCPADAPRYARYCSQHEHENWVRYEESRRRP